MSGLRVGIAFNPSEIMFGVQRPGVYIIQPLTAKITFLDGLHLRRFLERWYRFQHKRAAILTRLKIWRDRALTELVTCWSCSSGGNRSGVGSRDSSSGVTSPDTPTCDGDVGALLQYIRSFLKPKFYCMSKCRLALSSWCQLGVNVLIDEQSKKCLR